jgi:hypothetical protein
VEIFEEGENIYIFTFIRHSIRRVFKIAKREYELLNACLSFRPSVLLYVSPSAQDTNFYISVFLKHVSRKLKFYLNLTRSPPLCGVWSCLVQFFGGLRNVSEKFWKENQNIYFAFKNILPKIVLFFLDNVEKYSTDRQTERTQMEKNGACAL